MSHPPDERHQRDEARALDRFRELALVLSRESRALARLDAAVGRHELRQVRDVLVVERLLGQHLAAPRAEAAELAAARAVAATTVATTTTVPTTTGAHRAHDPASVVASAIE